MMRTLKRSSLIVFAALLASCQAFNKEPKTPEDSCMDTGRKGFCSDCITQEICSTNGSTSTVPCISGAVCLDIANAAPACVDPFKNPLCECPNSTEVALFPDPYDNQKFEVCIQGELTVEQCPFDQVFDPESKQCTTRITTTQITTTVVNSVPCPPFQFEVIKVSCTEFQVCYSDGSNTGVHECLPGEIFDERISECRPYELFSCSNYPGIGEYADTANCSVHHYCNSGVEVGVPAVCKDGQVFNNVSKVCVDDVTQCSALEDCGICKDGYYTNIKIDCYNYYHCTLNSDTGNWEPIYTTCPQGTYFDETELICVLGPPECTATDKQS